MRQFRKVGERDFFNLAELRKRSFEVCQPVFARGWTRPATGPSDRLAGGYEDELSHHARRLPSARAQRRSQHQHAHEIHREVQHHHTDDTGDQSARQMRKNLRAD